MSHPDPMHDPENVHTEDRDFREEALDIIQNKGVGEWLRVRGDFNIEALNAGYCIDIEGCCEEDRCDCVKYRGLSFEEIQNKIKESHA